jgi:hypothetical protein
VLRIKQLLYEEGFTIAGAKKRLEAEQGGRGATPSAMASLPDTEVTNVEVAAVVAPAPDDTRAVLLEVRDHLRGILTLLDKGDRKGN